jgi:hypothetical protein
MAGHLCRIFDDLKQEICSDGLSSLGESGLDFGEQRVPQS